MSKKPIFTKKDKNTYFEVVIFDGENSNGKYYSISCAKSYKDKNTGEYKKTNTIFATDSDTKALESVIALLEEAKRFLESNGEQPDEPNAVKEISVNFEDDDIPF